MGLYNIQKQKPADNDWIIILDESIEFGNEKMLAILGVREKDPDFIAYTKRLAYLRGSIPLSKLSYILPPAQRVNSRFMNLKPIIDWSQSMISLLKTDKQLLEERRKLHFILDYERFIKELSQIIEISIAIQKILKNRGLSQQTIEECKQTFPEKIKSPKIKAFKKEVVTYLMTMYDISHKMGSNKIICSSDILESSFGKYKSFIHANPSVGITDLSLSIPAFISNFEEQQEVCNACEEVKMRDIKNWRNNNIGKTLLKKRREVFNKWGVYKCA